MKPCDLTKGLIHEILPELGISTIVLSPVGNGDKDQHQYVNPREFLLQDAFCLQKLPTYII